MSSFTSFTSWKGLQVPVRRAQSLTTTGKHQHHRRSNTANPNCKKGTPRNEEDLKQNTTGQGQGSQQARNRPGGKEAHYGKGKRQRTQEGKARSHARTRNRQPPTYPPSHANHTTRAPTNRPPQRQARRPPWTTTAPQTTNNRKATPKPGAPRSSK